MGSNPIIGTSEKAFNDGKRGSDCCFKSSQGCAGKRTITQIILLKVATNGNIGK